MTVLTTQIRFFFSLPDQITSMCGTKFDTDQIFFFKSTALYINGLITLNPSLTQDGITNLQGRT